MTTQHTLTYPGKVDPTPGTLMGPGADGRVWSVEGTVHTDDGRSLVTVEEYTG